MSQPALSGAVSALEENLGVQLLERTTRKVLLSAAGERVAARAQRVLDTVSDLMEEAEAARAPFTGVVRLGVIPTVAPYLLPTVLRLVRGEYPQLDLQVSEEQTASLVDGLLRGRLDLLLLAVPLGATGVTEVPLFDEDFVLVSPSGHAYAGHAAVPKSALRELDLLLLDEGHCLRDQALDICREAGRADAPGTGGAGGTRGVAATGGPGAPDGPGSPVTTSVAGLSTLVQLVAGGMGVTLLPRTALQVETARNDELATGRFADPAPSRRIALAMRTGAAREEEFRTFADSLREALRSLPVSIVEPAER